MGDGGSGKSCFVLQYITGAFHPKFDPTIEDSYRKSLYTSNQTILLEILDTAPPDLNCGINFRELYKNHHGFILLYSITSRPSFDALSSWNNDIKRLKDSAHPIAVVGSKVDLGEKRQVRYDEGVAFADVIGASFWEVSTKTGENIPFVVMDVIGRCLDNKVFVTTTGQSKGGCELL
uniref:Uncharacterized protein n=1 Tax=Arcella intermedia TaxID=1963864 RepID=A0A6B2LLM6_9EUKA